MKTVKMIRYANEGFQNHLQEHIHRIKAKPIEGCYAFVEQVFPEFLVFSEPSMKDKNRDMDNKHEAFLSENTLVYVRNMKLPDNREDIFINAERDAVFIPLEPIVKEVTLNPHMSIPLPLEAYVEAPVGFVKDQLEELLSIYNWLENECHIRRETASINTKIIDFAEIIVNANEVKKQNPALL